MIAFTVGSLIQTLFADLLLGLIDSVAYNLIAIAYYIFSQVARLNLFGGTVSAALDIYNGFTSRVYTILSIVMIFVLAYQIILMIINPDGKGETTTNLIRDIIISMIGIALCPTIFRYMAIFQEHVIEDGTITAMVLGENASASNINTGSTFSMIVLQSMYHPTGSDYSTFIDEKGNLRTDEIQVEGRTYRAAVYDCIKNGSSEKVCTGWYNATSIWINAPLANLPSTFITTTMITTAGEIGNGVEYMWILSTGVAIAVVWFIASYVIDLGKRAVKLGFLQIVAPVALILKVVPTMKKSYDKWLNQLIKTYIDVFLKLFVISFVIQICLLIPAFLTILFGSGSNVIWAVKPIAGVCLILGLLSFGREAPTLLKDLVGGNDLFSDFNWRPGVRSRINENTAGISAAVGFIGGGIGNAARSANQYYNDSRWNNHEDAVNDEGRPYEGNLDNVNVYDSAKRRRTLGAFGHALSGFTRGAVTGAQNGAQNSMDNVSIRNIVSNFGENAEHSAAEGQQHDDAVNETRNRILNSNNYDRNDPLDRIVASVAGHLRHSVLGEAIANNAEDVGDAASDVGENFTNALQGISTAVNDATDKLIKGLEDMSSQMQTKLEGAQYEQTKKAYEDALKDINLGAQSINFLGHQIAFTDDDGNVDAKKMKETLEGFYKEYIRDTKTKTYDESKENYEEQMATLYGKKLEEGMANFSNSIKNAIQNYVNKYDNNKYENQNVIDVINKLAENPIAQNEEFFKGLTKVINQAKEQQQALDAAQKLGRPQHNNNNNNNNNGGSN